MHYAFESCDSLHDYEEWAKLLGHPEVPIYVAARWEMDVEFGRQMLNGVNPVVIEKCTSLPPNFHVTNEMVKGFLNRGRTLEQEMEVGEIKCLDSSRGQYSIVPFLLFVLGEMLCTKSQSTATGGIFTNLHGDTGT